MVDNSPPANPTANRIKMLMIPVLGVILLYFVFTPGDQPAVPTLVARPAGAANGATVAPSAETNTAPVTWPSIPLSRVLAVNPFQRPESLKPYTIPTPATEVAQPVVEVAVPPTPPAPMIMPEEQAAKDEALQAELEASLKAHRLSAIIRTSKGIGAMVGDRVVNVGDKLDDRFRVGAIRAEGLVLELIEPVEGVPAQPVSTSSSSPSTP
jgi:hypothetical protein